MAFINIKDPKKREEIVQDYINTLREVQQRSENQKTYEINEQQKFQKVFKPIVDATKESTSQITQEIKKKEEPVKKNEVRVVRGSREWDPTRQNAMDFYKDKGNLDQYFGIQRIGDGDQFMMGDRQVKVLDSNIFVMKENKEHKPFKGTPGLWRLIMEKKPINFDENDLQNYKELLNNTNVINSPRTSTNKDRPYGTAKYEFIQGLEAESEEDEDEVEERDGDGIYFLPGDIKGLISKLTLLLGEYQAGNKSTNTQIVAILDQLLRLGYLNQEEYNAVCKNISC